MNRDDALKIIEENVENKNIIKHMLATEAVMKALCNKLRVKNSEFPPEADEPMAQRMENFNEEKWGLAGLLHDGDYSEKVPVEKQGIEIASWVEEKGFSLSDEVKHAMAAHNMRHTGINPESKMDWSIFCCDSLTGLITACALVLPDKKLSDVTVERVLKRFKEPKFAAGTRRDEIQMCEEKLGLPLEEFVKIALEGMQKIAPQLGL